MQTRATALATTGRSQMIPVASSSLRLLLLLLCPALLLLASAREFTCRPPDPSLMSFCGDSVPYLIASDLDEASASYYAKEQHDKSCSFYAYKPYACRKFFPECRNTSVLIPRTNQATGVTSWIDSGNYTSVEYKICKYACQRGWNDECKRFFTAAGLELECSLPDYYVDASPPVCVDSGFLDSSTDKSLYWKIGLGVGLGLIACIALFFLARRHLRDKWTPEQMAAYDDAQADKLRAKRIKEKNAAAAKAKREEAEREKKEAKQRKKYAADPAAAATAAADAGGSVPAGAGRGADAAGGEVFSDLELGSPSPAAPAAAAAGATAASSADGTGAPRSGGGHKSHKHKSHHAGAPSRPQEQQELMVMSPAARKNAAYAQKNADRDGTAGAGAGADSAAKAERKKAHKSSHKADKKHSSHRSGRSSNATEQKSAEEIATALPPEEGHAPVPSAPPAPSSSPAAAAASAAASAVEPAAVRIHFADADNGAPVEQAQQQAQQQDDDSWKSGLPTRVAPPED